MKLISTDFDGLFIIENFFAEDHRGSFTKVFNSALFEKAGINFTPKEIYYSVSHKDVIRGLHFQTPPMDHSKLVYVASCSIIDFVLDIRKNSKTFGKHFSIQLNTNQNTIFIPHGFAHGFKSLENNTIVVYNQTSCYSKDNDAGIRWNSFKFDWEIDMDKEIKVWYDKESDYLEVIFEKKEGYFSQRDGNAKRNR